MYRADGRVGWGRLMHDHGPDPEEYFALTAGVGGSPEKRLRLAVLLNAIAQLQRGDENAAAQEAARWVRGEIDAMHVSFSFAAICEALDIDAGFLARTLLGAGGGANGSVTRLPRRQVRTQRLHGVARRYRPRDRAAAE